jgi:hypothetical protein
LTINPSTHISGYRNSIIHFKENDMTRIASQSMAAVAAIILALGSISAIVAVPPASAQTVPVASMATELA